MCGWALATSETQLLTAPGREYFLRASLEKTRLLENAVVLVDSPPSLGILALNCLTAAGGLIVAVQPGGFELHALASLETSVRMIRERVNPDLNVLGILLTYCQRTRRNAGDVNSSTMKGPRGLSGKLLGRRCRDVRQDAIFVRDADEQCWLRGKRGFLCSTL